MSNAFALHLPSSTHRSRGSGAPNFAIAARTANRWIQHQLPEISEGFLKGDAVWPFIFAQIIRAALMAPPRRRQQKGNVGVSKHGWGSGFGLPKVT
jgi:hypothetical protein